MKCFIVLAMLLAACAAGSIGPWFPWINVGGAVVFLIIAIRVDAYYNSKGKPL